MDKIITICNGRFVNYRRVSRSLQNSLHIPMYSIYLGKSSVKFLDEFKLTEFRVTHGYKRVSIYFENLSETFTF